MGSKPREKSAGADKKTNPPLSRGKSALFLAISLAFPFLLLALLEGTLRIASYGGDTSAFQKTGVAGTRYLAPGSNLGRRYLPQEKVPPSPSRDAFLEKKPAHSMRIFVLGESSAAGFPYPPNGTFSRVLDDALTDVLPNDTVEVVNMGMAATNSYTIVDLAQDIIEQHPDAVIIYGGHNEYYGALGAASGKMRAHSSFVRLYLRLARFKTFLLLRNAAAALLRPGGGGGATRDVEAHASALEGLVRNQSIPLDSRTYLDGVDQYESNLRVATGKFRSAGIAVFIGSTPSNLKDLAPFGAFAIPPDSSASIIFDSARVLLAADSVRAASLFSRARDLDVIRFRAPSEFQSVVERIAAETNSIYVPVAEGFGAASPYRIPGAELFLEHVHPNQRGYVLLARMYFDAIQRAHFVGRSADVSRLQGWDAYMQRMSLTDLDERIAYHTTKAITTRWPFVSVSNQLDYRGTYRPANYLDSLAFSVSRGGTSWANAKSTLAARYLQTGHPADAAAEYVGLERDARARGMPEPRDIVGFSSWMKISATSVH